MANAIVVSNQWKWKYSSRIKHYIILHSTIHSHHAVPKKETAMAVFRVITSNYFTTHHILSLVFTIWYPINIWFWLYKNLCCFNILQMTSFHISSHSTSMFHLAIPYKYTCTLSHAIVWKLHYPCFFQLDWFILYLKFLNLFNHHFQK